MSYKIKELNPNFSEDIITDMLNTYKRSYIKYLYDIIVKGDAVFTKEGEFDDFGRIYKIDTFIFEQGKNSKYYDIFNYRLFSMLESISIIKKEVEISREEKKELFNFICKNINSILKDKYPQDAVASGFGIERNNLWDTNIYLNKRYADIAKSYLNQDDLDIKMCVQSGEDIKMYKIHQTFVNDKPIWTSEKLDLPIWKLSDAAMKKEVENNSKKLIKK